MWLLPSIHGGKFWGDGGTGSGTYFGGGLGLGIPIGYACSDGTCSDCQAGNNDLSSMETEDIGANDNKASMDSKLEPPKGGDTSIGMG